MAKGKTLEQIEAQMAKLKEKKDALHAELQALAAERRAMILSSPGVPSQSNGSVVLEPDPAVLTAKSVQ